MSDKPHRWLFFTAGLGSDDFEASAKRLAEQANSFGIFETVKAFTTDEVKSLCPRLSQWYVEEDLANIKGFGWYTWKSKLADLIIREELLGKFDGYMYLDSGCELFLSGFSKNRLKAMMESAITNDATLFTIPTPEIWHTKKNVLDLFEESQEHAQTYQFQSGSWLVSNSAKCKQLVKRWEEIAKISPEMTDETLSKGGENSDYKVHRYDQAIFSMVCKEIGFQSSNYVIPGSNQSAKYLLRAFFYPFWWARNRTGTTVIPSFMTTLGRFSLKIWS